MKDSFNLPAQFKECENCVDFDVLLDNSKAHCAKFGFIDGVQMCRRKTALNEYVSTINMEKTDGREE